MRPACLSLAGSPPHLSRTVKGVIPLKIWRSFADVDRTVRSVATAHRHTGQVPPLLASAVNEQLRGVTRGMRMRFYEQLGEHRPEALNAFVQEEPQTRVA